jgi:carbon storage regulator
VLVLSRKAGEAILLNDGVSQEIKITVLRVIGGRVKIGIEAPANVEIQRDELLAKAHTVIAE